MQSSPNPVVEMQGKVMEGNAQADNMSWKVVDSNPGARKILFSHEIFVKVNLYNHLAVEFEQ